MPDPRTPIDPLERIGYEIKKVNDRIDLLALPSGTSQFQTVTKLKALVEDIQDQLDDYIANGTYNKAQIDTMRGSSPAGFTVNGALEVNGNEHVDGALGVDGVVTATGGIISPDARARVLTSSYVAAYWDGSGRAGYVPSTLASKDVTGPFTIDLDAWLDQPILRFTYKDDEAKAPRIGYIVDTLNELVPEAVVHDEGEPVALHHEAVVVAVDAALREAVAEYRTQNAALLSRIEALEATQ